MEKDYPKTFFLDGDRDSVQLTTERFANPHWNHWDRNGSLLSWNSPSHFSFHPNENGVMTMGGLMRRKNVQGKCSLVNNGA